MNNGNPRLRRQLVLLLACSLGVAATAHGQVITGSPDNSGDGRLSVPSTQTPVTDALPPTVTADATPTPAPADIPTTPAAAPSQNVTINLIHRMVERGLLTKEDSADLIKQAEADALLAREQADAVRSAVEQVALSQTSINSPVISGSPELGPEVPGETYPPEDDTVRVTYIPEVVKAQMREDIYQEVLEEVNKHPGAWPNAVPDWVSRFKLFADLRIRYQGDYFPNGNDNTGSFPNFNAINTGAPFDVTGAVFSPQLNVDQDRERVRIRVRFGADVTLRENFTGGIRIATGESNSPVTQNQTLGAANGGQGGNFSKYAIWLDRAFIKYEVTAIPHTNLAITAGRFENPFFATNILWADDLGFDGFVLQSKVQLSDAFSPFLTAGAFPVFNTDLNFSSNQPAKFDSTDKWLYAGQLGFNWKVAPTFTAKLAIAYYDFDDVQGKLSDPFVPLNASDAGNTDTTRPSFAQKGNTYFPLRNIVPVAGTAAQGGNESGTINQFQYYGLAAEFRELAISCSLTYDPSDRFRLTFMGEYVKNLAWDGGKINAVAINNQSGSDSTTGLGNYDGGDTAWIVSLRMGTPAMAERWDWNVGVNYRYVESDSVVDGFNDSDFGGGGTNVKGYTIGGALALSPDVSFGLRWLSASEIAGPPLEVDTLQVELNSKF